MALVTKAKDSEIKHNNFLIFVLIKTIINIYLFNYLFRNGYSL